MFTKQSFYVSVLSLVVALCGAVSPVQAATYSLATDFSLSNNGTGGNPWSYCLDKVVGEPVQPFTLGNNTRNANTMWGTSFATPPTMWSDLTGDTSGVAGIGKNLTGVTLTDAGTGISWAPGEILLRPVYYGTPYTRFVIGWTAPSAGTIDGNWTFSKAATAGAGDGVGYMLIRGGATTPIQGFGSQTPPNTTNGPMSSSFTGLSVAAGDKLWWRMDAWGSAGTNDITKAAITITMAGEPATDIPEPATMVLLGTGLLGLVRHARRRIGA